MFCVPVLRALNKIHSSNCELKLTRLHTLPVAGLLGVKVVGVTSATSVNKLVTAPCVLVVEEPLKVHSSLCSCCRRTSRSRPGSYPPPCPCYRHLYRIRDPNNIHDKQLHVIFLSGKYDVRNT